MYNAATIGAVEAEAFDCMGKVISRAVAVPCMLVGVLPCKWPTSCLMYVKVSVKPPGSEIDNRMGKGTMTCLENA